MYSMKKFDLAIFLDEFVLSFLWFIKADLDIVDVIKIIMTRLNRSAAACLYTW